VDRFYGLDLLIVTVSTRVKIGPGNRAREWIIPCGWSGWIHVPGVEMMSCSNASEAADGGAQIHVVPCDEHAPTSSPKRVYPAAVFFGQAVSDIYGE